MKEITFAEYQRESQKTIIDPERKRAYIYYTLGLSGETGEIAEHTKKVIRDDDYEITPERRKQLRKELGDVLWYLSQLISELGFEFGDIAQHNLEKLADRKKRGKLHGSGDNR